ncbi:hypothetical protein Slin15195_G085680 [Septoria linicola]|uniref:Uncharacterized protein n=1 Tax=Septoria linicola TaxID=215465 RepID=A0A9Q9ATQ5_9PEZI|nr:hypothetical protein Slin14017_G088270 [Septoria linicola]USW55249.1 hypothetical protein Slin15195_G085680 [Septoria linicola]
MSSQKQQSQPTSRESNGPSKAEIRQESSKAAEKALEAQQKADELKQAAHGAADADERQKLMEQAIDKQIEAESLGKTAKYMRGGAFQGMCVGAGLGTAPGLTLGTLTGTIVGGLTSTLLGGLGAGLGGLVGWAHGPFWNMGEVIGRGVRKVTGDLPSWKASDDQKKKLEEMIAQANDEEMPGTKELKSMANDGWDGAKHQGNAWYKTGASYMPGSRPYNSGKAQDGAWQSKINAKQDDEPVRASPETVKSVKQASRSAQNQTPQQAPRKAVNKDSDPASQESQQDSQARKQPRKLERRSGDIGTDTKDSTAKSRKPRKLELRS